MTREDPQLKLRLPEALRDAIWQQSVSNKRSMNAELVARLEATLSDNFSHNTNPKSLVGMFFLQDNGDFYRTGEILSEIKAHFDKVTEWAKTQPPEVYAAYLWAIKEILKMVDSRLQINELGNQVSAVYQTIPRPEV